MSLSSLPGEVAGSDIFSYWQSFLGGFSGRITLMILHLALLRRGCTQGMKALNDVLSFLDDPVYDLFFAGHIMNQSYHLTTGLKPLDSPWMIGYSIPRS